MPDLRGWEVSLAPKGLQMFSFIPGLNPMVLRLNFPLCIHIDLSFAIGAQ